jgi:hypothetical protein
MDHIFSKIQPATDINDKVRQKEISLKKSWITKDWDHRIDTTALGCLITDAYFIFSKLTKQGKPKYPRDSLRGGQEISSRILAISFWSIRGVQKRYG